MAVRYWTCDAEGSSYARGFYMKKVGPTSKKIGID